MCVVVGCYKGKIYFLNTLNGSIGWTFQTSGEVKSQPVVDRQRHLVWCGSYDHRLYALDYQSYSCTYKLDCGGSIYGSPAINEVDERLYFASTNGCMTALSLKAVPFSVLWVQDLGAPVFGSLSINHNGNVICCLVNGHVVAVDVNGSVIVCSRDGGVYSFNSVRTCVDRISKLHPCIDDLTTRLCFQLLQDTGNLLWKHDLGDPISSSAYIDEHLQDHSDRLICVCGSSGSIVVLRVELHVEERYVVEEFGRVVMEGGVFSSPVMIGGKVFVGCRDDYFHCLRIQTNR
ncbi:putative L-aminoadipate-semialdehyde dehydrogenase transcription factor WD40-like family [Helianthus annuus]|nr:putative L-aminoadipate-semialdehyde dehydrogenase transcription factor WD40-like family [Helianthus annuus]